MSSLLAAAQQQQQAAATAATLRPPAGATVHVRDLSFHPPGTEAPLISGINMTLPANSLNLIIGRSGSGKTTLLQLLAGLCEQTSGQVSFGQAEGGGGSSLEERMQRVGLVFQFPERHFLGETRNMHSATSALAQQSNRNLCRYGPAACLEFSHLFPLFSQVTQLPTSSASPGLRPPSAAGP